MYNKIMLTPANNKKLFIFTVVTVGILLRWYSIFDHSLWMDEGSVLREIVGNSFSEIWNERHYMQPQNAPLAPMIYSIFMRVFNIGDFLSLRYVSFLFSIMTLIFFGKFIKNILGEKLEDSRYFLIFFLFAISTYHIQYSQLIRFYVFLSFFTVTNIIWFFYFIKKPSFFNTFFFLLTASLGFWTNQIFMAIALVNTVYCFFVFILKRGITLGMFFKVSLAYLVAFVSYLPSYLIYLNSNGNRIGGFRSPSLVETIYALKVNLIPSHLGPSVLELRELFNHKRASGEMSYFDVFLNNPNYLFVLGLTIVIFCLFLKVKTTLSYEKISKSQLYFTSLVFTLAFLMGYFWVKKIPMNSRYFYILFPIFLTFLGSLKCNNKRINTWFISLLLILNSFSLYNYFFDPKFRTLNVRDLVKFLESKYSNNDKLITFANSDSILRYYSEVFNAKKSFTLVDRIDLTAYEKFFKSKNSFVITFSPRTMLDTDRLKSFISNTHDLTPIEYKDPFFKLWLAVKKN